MKQHLKRALELVFVPIAAAIVFFEQVLIAYLSVVMAALARLTWVARLEAWLMSLPPYGALAAFVGPSLFILPAKLVALWLLTHDRYWTALVLVIVAKLSATAILARLYRLLRPALMTIGWYAWADTHFFRWRDRLYAFVKALPAWQRTALLVQRARAWLAELVSALFAR